MKLSEPKIRTLRTLAKAEGQMQLRGPDVTAARGMIRLGYVSYYGNNYYSITVSGRRELIERGSK